MPSTKRRKPKLPRVPLPRQTGGKHQDKRKKPSKYKEDFRKDPWGTRTDPHE